MRARIEELVDAAFIAMPYGADEALRRAMIAAVEEALEMAAKICDDKYSFVLSKQTTGERNETERAVNQNLRLVSVLLPDCASAIRKLKEEL